jgi:hypothetical protein
MQTIHKFNVYPTEERHVEMPAGAQLLSVKSQNDIPQLWALVNTDRPMAKRLILARGTGHDCTDLPGTFIDTVVIHDDSLVFHYFDGGEV